MLGGRADVGIGSLMGGTRNIRSRIREREKTPLHIVSLLKDKADLKRQRKNAKRLDNACFGGWTSHGLSVLRA